MEFHYGFAPKVNGQAIDYDRWNFFEDPYLKTEKRLRKREIAHRSIKRTLDFNTVKISDSVAPRY